MNERVKNLALKLAHEHELDRNEWIELIEGQDDELYDFVAARARMVREEHYGKDVYVRGLIEFSNICKNDCYYCGIRKSNETVNRYRLTDEQILACCEIGYNVGYRTFVLQGGEDGYYTDERMCKLVSEIRYRYPDCAITLSIGERSYDSYKKLREAGADRYLLRHETADSEHYSKLHPSELSLDNRKTCLWNLKELGYQVGAGFMVGAPFQTAENLADDMLFLKELNPAMVGIGPFIPCKETPFGHHSAGTLEQTLYLLALIRLMLPKVLLPATTALGTIAEDGRERGILSGANVIMPNLSPKDVRDDYMLYDNKLRSGSESAEHIEELSRRMESIGYKIVFSRGDSLMDNFV